MMSIEDIVSEIREDINEQGLPPGFRFHPTDEELVTFYLASKVFNGSFCGAFPIAEVDLNRCEPWELPDVAKVGEREWYFFSLRDRKYPTGVRTNRATGAGYWKATGKDREVKSASNGGLLGMKKTLVFYKGRAPRGEKTKWVMHEYRLAGAHFSYPHTCKEEWVICRIVHKRGEKIYPTILFQGQSYQLLEACSSPPTLTTTTATTMGGSLLLPTLPENAAATTTKSSSSTAEMLLETQSHYPFLIMDHHQHQIQVYQEEGCFSPTSPPPPRTHTHTHAITTTTIPNVNPSPSSTSSILFNSLLSHQQLTTTIPKQCNSTTTGGNFSLFQPPHANLLWADKIHTTTDSPPFSNPLFFGMDCGGGVSSAVPDSTTVTVMPTATTSVAAAFSNRANHPIPNLCESSSSSSHISYWTTLAAFGSLRSFQNIDS